MARLPAGKPASENCPSESVTTNFLTSGTEIVTPAMGRPLKSEIATPRMRALLALLSERACACTDETSRAALTTGKAIMFESLSPTHWLPLILPLEPGNERLEILYDGRRVHLPFAGCVSEDLLPRFALSRRQHAGQLLPRGAVAIDRAAVQRSRPSSGTAPGPMKLELQDARQKIAHVGNVGGDVELRAGIEVALRSSGGLGDALVAMLEVPPCCIVVRRRDLPRKHSPAPAVKRQRERQKRDLVERDP